MLAAEAAGTIHLSGSRVIRTEVQHLLQDWGRNLRSDDFVEIEIVEVSRRNVGFWRDYDLN